MRLLIEKGLRIKKELENNCWQPWKHAALSAILLVSLGFAISCVCTAASEAKAPLKAFDLANMNSSISPGDDLIQSARSRTGYPHLVIGNLTELTIPTYDGSGECVHPSVVYFSSPWGGYKYWMAFTPYPEAQEYYENPSIVASNDGTSWEVPSGITNPIDGFSLSVFGILRNPNDNVSKHNCDPSLVYDSISDKLWLYYTEALSSSNIHIYRHIISSDHTLALKVECTMSSTHVVSPAIIYDTNTSKWIMWYCGLYDRLLYRTDSLDGLTWSSPIRLSINSHYVLWHPSVFSIDGKYMIIVAAYPSHSDNAHNSLYETQPFNPYDPIYLNIEPILVPATSGWTSGQIYKSCIVSVDGQYKIFVSASDNSEHWHIGSSDVTIQYSI